MPISKINTSSITDNSVTAGKIVAGAVDADIAAGSIDTAQIADDAVTADKLANAINTSIAAKLPLAGGTMTGTIADFRSTGIDDNSNALAMTIDANENIGLGSVPATDWHANYSVLQLGGQAGFWTHKAVGTGKALHISHNTEYDTGFKYIASDEASLYMQGDGGKHIFSTAAAGTAGNAISFSEKVRIDTDGLKFNGDTAASNALDDYEEGTWTPVMNIQTNPNFSTDSAYGHYTKIGKKEGKYRFYNSSQNSKLYVDFCEFNELCIILGQGGEFNIHIDKNFTPSKHVCVLKLVQQNELLLRYIYYLIPIIKDSLVVNGSIMGWLNNSNIKKIKLKIPKNKQLIADMEQQFLELEQLHVDVKNADKKYKDLIEELRNEGIKQ